MIFHSLSSDHRRGLAEGTQESHRDEKIHEALPNPSRRVEDSKGKGACVARLVSVVELVKRVFAERQVDGLTLYQYNELGSLEVQHAVPDAQHSPTSFANSLYAALFPFVHAKLSDGDWD